MPTVRKIGLLLLVVFIVAQFIQPARNESGQVMPADISKLVSVPQQVDALLKAACYDCHSNNTRYPWYTYIQPAGWILNSHIKKGKAELNFNEFGSYTIRRQKSKFRSIASQVSDDAMPLASYKWLHKKARLSKEEKALIIDWATKANEIISAGK